MTASGDPVGGVARRPPIPINLFLDSKVEFFVCLDELGSANLGGYRSRRSSRIMASLLYLKPEGEWVALIDENGIITGDTRPSADARENSRTSCNFRHILHTTME